jgi:penicillin amidase
MPRLKDPASGFIVTANNRVIGTSFPVPVSTHFGGASRARRIRDLIEKAKSEGRKLDRAAMEAIQLDTVSDLLRALMREVGPHLPPALAAAFHGWDGRADPTAPLFLVARTARRKVGEEAFRSWGVRGDVFLSEIRAVDLVMSSPEAFKRAGLGDKSAFLDRVAKAALAELSSRFGRDERSWTWGDANRLAVRHPLGRIPGLSWLLDPPSFPQPGATGVVRVTAPTFGQSMRFIVDWGDPAAATLVVPFGVSGHAGSPHRFDQLPYWRNGDPDGVATRLARPPTGSVLTFVP